MTWVQHGPYMNSNEDFRPFAAAEPTVAVESCSVADDDGDGLQDLGVVSLGHSPSLLLCVHVCA